MDAPSRRRKARRTGVVGQFEFPELAGNGMTASGDPNV